MAPSPSTGGIAGVQKSKTTKDEVNHQLLWSYGVACTNWAHDESLRALMDSKYHKVIFANDLLAQLLNKDLKDNVFNVEYIKTVSDAVSDVKSEIAPLFIREVVNNYIGPPSGQNDLEEYDSEYVSNFNLMMKQSDMSAYAAEYKDFQKKLQNASSDEEKGQLQFTLKYSFTKHHLPLLCWFGQFDTLGAWLGCNVTDVSANRKGQASTGRKQVQEEDIIIQSQVPSNRKRPRDPSPVLSAVSDNNKVNEAILHELSVLSRAINRNATTNTKKEHREEIAHDIHMIRQAIQTTESDIKRQGYISCVEQIADEAMLKYRNKKDTTILAETPITTIPNKNTKSGNNKSTNNVTTATSSSEIINSDDDEEEDMFDVLHNEPLPITDDSDMVKFVDEEYVKSKFTNEKDRDFALDLLDFCSDKSRYKLKNTCVQGLGSMIVGSKYCCKFVDDYGISDSLPDEQINIFSTPKDVIVTEVDRKVSKKPVVKCIVNDSDINYEYFSLNTNTKYSVYRYELKSVIN